MPDAHAGEPVAIEAGLWFSYGRANKRPGVESRTTFDAVIQGERTSTTRFARWPGHALWTRISPGDLVRFHQREDRTGGTIVVRVSSVRALHLWTCSDAELEEWSRCEGWSENRGRELGRELGAALWFRHDLVWPLRPEPSIPAQGSLF